MENCLVMPEAVGTGTMPGACTVRLVAASDSFVVVVAFVGRVKVPAPAALVYGARLVALGCMRRVSKQGPSSFGGLEERHDRGHVAGYPVVVSAGMRVNGPLACLSESLFHDHFRRDGGPCVEEVDYASCVGAAYVTHSIRA